MTSNYKYTRNWENQQKRLFTDYDVAGDYDIPIIRPEYDFHSGACCLGKWDKYKGYRWKYIK